MGETLGDAGLEPVVAGVEGSLTGVRSRCDAGVGQTLDNVLDSVRCFTVDRGAGTGKEGLVELKTAWNVRGLGTDIADLPEEIPR